MTEPEHPIYIDQFWQGSHHYFDESNVDYFERRPEDGFNVWLETDQIPPVPPAQSAYPGTASLEASGVSGLALTDAGDGKTFTSGIVDALLNIIPANYNDGAYQFRLFDVNGTEVPYNPDVWVADGIQQAIYFKEGVPSGFTAPFTFDYWQYTGATAGTSVISGGINLGGGAEVFKDVIAPNMRFRTLVGGGNITVSETGFDTIRIEDNGGSNNNDLKLYVSQNGNDANDGTLASPFLTLGRAFDEVEAVGWNDTAEIRILNTGGPLVMPPILNLSTGARGRQREPLIIRGWGTGAGGAVDGVVIDTTGSLIMTINDAGAFASSDTGRRMRFTSGPMTAYSPEVPGFDFSNVSTVAEVFMRYVNNDNVQLTYADIFTQPAAGNTYDVLENNTSILLSSETAWTTDGSNIVLEDLNITVDYLGSSEARFNFYGKSEVRFRGVVITDTGAPINSSFQINYFAGTTLTGGIQAVDEDATTPGIVPNTKSLAVLTDPAGVNFSTLYVGSGVEPAIMGRAVYSNALMGKPPALGNGLALVNNADFVGQSIIDQIGGGDKTTTIDRTLMTIGTIFDARTEDPTLNTATSSTIIHMSNVHVTDAVGGTVFRGPVTAYITGYFLVDSTSFPTYSPFYLDRGAEVVVEADRFELAVTDPDVTKYTVIDSTLKILDIGAAVNVFRSGGTLFDVNNSELVFGPDVFDGFQVDAGPAGGGGTNYCFNLRNSRALLRAPGATVNLNTTGEVGIQLISSSFEAQGYNLNLGQNNDGHDQALIMRQISSLNANAMTITDMATRSNVSSGSTLSLAGTLTFAAPNVNASQVQLLVEGESKVNVTQFDSDSAPLAVLLVQGESSFNCLGAINVVAGVGNITNDAIVCDLGSSLTATLVQFDRGADVNAVRVSNQSKLTTFSDFTVTSAVGNVSLLVEDKSSASIGGTATLNNAALRALLLLDESVFHSTVLVASNSNLANVFADRGSKITVEDAMTTSNSTTEMGVFLDQNSTLTVGGAFVANDNATNALSLNNSSQCDIGGTLTAAGNTDTLFLVNGAQLSVSVASNLSDDTATVITAANGSKVIFSSNLTLGWVAGDANPVIGIALTNLSDLRANNLFIESAPTNTGLFISASGLDIGLSLTFTNVGSGTVVSPILCKSLSSLRCTTLNVGTQYDGDGVAVVENSEVFVLSTATMSNSGLNRGLFVDLDSTFACENLVASDNNLTNVQAIQNSKITVGTAMTVSNSVTGAGALLDENSTLTVGGAFVANDNATNALSLNNGSECNLGSTLTATGNTNTLVVANSSRLSIEGLATLRDDSGVATSITSASVLSVLGGMLFDWVAGDANPTTALSVVNSECLVQTSVNIASAPTGDAVVVDSSRCTVASLLIAIVGAGAIGGRPFFITNNAQFTCGGDLSTGSSFNGNGIEISDNSDVSVAGALTAAFSLAGYGLYIYNESTLQTNSLLCTTNNLDNVLIEKSSSVTATLGFTVNGSVTGAGATLEEDSTLTVGGNFSATDNATNALSLNNGSECNVGGTLTAAGNTNTLALANSSRLSVEGAVTLSNDSGNTVSATDDSKIVFLSTLDLTWAAAEANPVFAIVVLSSEMQVGDLTIEVSPSANAIFVEYSQFTADSITVANVASGIIGAGVIFCSGNSQFSCVNALDVGSQYNGIGFQLTRNSTAVSGDTTLSNSSGSNGLQVDSESVFVCSSLVASSNSGANIDLLRNACLTVTNSLTANNSVTNAGIRMRKNSTLTVGINLVANGNATNGMLISDGSECNVGGTLTAAGNTNTLVLTNSSRLSVEGIVTLSDDAGVTLSVTDDSNVVFLNALNLTWAAAEANPTTALSIEGSEFQAAALSIAVASTGDSIVCDNSKFTADSVTFANVASGTIGGRPIFCTNNSQFYCTGALTAGAQYTGNGFELSDNSDATIDGAVTLSDSGGGVGLFMNNAATLVCSSTLTASNNFTLGLAVFNSSTLNVTNGATVASSNGSTGVFISAQSKFNAFSITTNDNVVRGVNVDSDSNVYVGGALTCGGSTSLVLVFTSSSLYAVSATLSDASTAVIQVDTDSAMTVSGAVTVPWVAGDAVPSTFVINVIRSSKFYAASLTVSTATTAGDAILCDSSEFEVSGNILFNNSAAGSITGSVINCSRNSRFTCGGTLNVGNEYTVNGLLATGSSDVHVVGAATFIFLGAVNPNTGNGVFATSASTVSFGSTVTARSHDNWGLVATRSSTIDILGTIDIRDNGVGNPIGSGGGIGALSASKFTSGDVLNSTTANGPSLMYLDAADASVGVITVTNEVSVITAVSGSKISCGNLSSNNSTGVVISLTQSIMTADNLTSTGATGGPIILMTSSTLKAFSFTGNNGAGSNVTNEVNITGSKFLLGNYSGGAVTLGTYTTNVTTSSTRFFAKASDVFTQAFSITGGTSINAIVLDMGVNMVINGNVNITSGVYNIVGLSVSSESTVSCLDFTCAGGINAITLRLGSSFSAETCTLTGTTGSGLAAGQSRVNVSNLIIDDCSTGVAVTQQLSLVSSSELIVDVTLSIDSTGGLSKIGFEIDSSRVFAQGFTVSDCQIGSIIREGGMVMCDSMTLTNNATDGAVQDPQLKLINDSTLIVDGALTINDTPNTCPNSLRIIDGSKVTCVSYTNGGLTSASTADVFLSGRSELIVSNEPAGTGTFTGTASPPTYLYMDTGSMFLCDVFLINNAGAAIAGPVIETSDGCQLNIEDSCNLGSNFTGDGIVMRGTLSSVRAVTADGGATGILVDAGTARFYGATVLNNMTAGGIDASRGSNVIFETDDIGAATFSTTATVRSIECQTGSKMTFASCNVTITDGTNFAIIVNEGSALFMNGVTTLIVDSTAVQTSANGLLLLNGSWADLDIFATFGGSSGDAIRVEGLSRLSCFRLLQGTIANGGYGLNLITGASARVAQKNTSTVTGASGDVFLGGQGVKTWANINTGGVANRNDYATATTQNVAIS